jgi:hypothetical protein
MPVSRPLAHAHSAALVLGAGLLLSGVGAGFVGYVASEEPFFFMSTPTLLMLEALGLGLLVLFGTWGAMAVSLARRVRWQRLRVALATLACSWTLVCFFYLATSMASCWEDYQRFRHGVTGTLGQVAVGGRRDK